MSLAPCRTHSWVLAPLLAIAAFGPVRAAVAPKTLDPKASCISKGCHDDYAKKKHVHGPVAEKDCKVCHTWKDNKHKFELLHDDAKLCTGCHEDMDVAKLKTTAKAKKKKLVIHEPIEEDCTTCHVSHASDKKGLLSMPLLEMCEACHDEQFDEINGKGIRSRHAMAIKGKACLSCHTSHSSSHAKLLTVASRATCLSCHTDPVKAGKHTLPGMKAQLAKKHVHGPTEDEDCTECHSPHGSKQVTLLKHAYPASFYSAFASDAYALCFECHDAELVTVADTDEHTEFRNAKRNLHHLHVNKKTKGRSCRTCHAAHASDQPSQIRNSVPFGSSGWSIPIRFQKTEDGGSCQSGCHEPRRYDREKTIDTAIPVVRPKSPKPEPEPKPGPAERAKPPEK